MHRTPDALVPFYGLQAFVFVDEWHVRQGTKASVAAKAFAVHRETKLHAWVSDSF
ncbi:hypothetical protein AVDCRST_MAG94-6839 [uncultured Leptolyngbya sp.]|uniref:Uncharacterized protein n=1 Tax=uncultured Leptolyngbya sp. TaxID=332963 RepID=A0A6J4PSJ2_9CYAN|nr:hypothetical protein AVDCRST_MAG94-6839 [uncultured Leptolyngbya sp.]